MTRSPHSPLPPHPALSPSGGEGSREPRCARSFGWRGGVGGRCRALPRALLPLPLPPPPPGARDRVSLGALRGLVCGWDWVVDGGCCHALYSPSFDSALASPLEASGSARTAALSPFGGEGARGLRNVGWFVLWFGRRRGRSGRSAPELRARGPRPRGRAWLGIRVEWRSAGGGWRPQCRGGRGRRWSGGRRRG